MQQGACLSVLVGARAAAESVVFSACGRWLATGLADGQLWLWRSEEEEVEEEEGGFEEWVGSGGFPAAARVAAAVMEARLDVGMRLLLNPPDVDAQMAREMSAAGTSHSHPIHFFSGVARAPSPHDISSLVYFGVCMYWRDVHVRPRRRWTGRFEPSASLRKKVNT